jgi:hypothetical protein
VNDYLVLIFSGCRVTEKTIHLPAMKQMAVIFAFCLALFLVAVISTPAFALQTHAAPEGLYVHQIGHVLFAIAMFGFALRIRHSRLNKQKSWRLMSVGAILFALWNGWAFIGHILALLISKGDFSRGSDGLKSILVLNSPIDVLYYLFKMDHFLCFPALLFIYLALKRMTAQPADSAGSEKNPQ